MIRSLQINFRFIHLLNNGLFVFLIILVTGPIIVLHSDQLREKTAIDEQREFQNHGCKNTGKLGRSRCVEVADSRGQTVERGLLAARTPLGLAIYDGNETKIVAVRDEQVLRFTKEGGEE